MTKKSMLLAIITILAGCSDRELDPNDAGKSFLIAKKPYDDGNFEIALNKLGEFSSRFPYSNFAIEAELLLANSHFELGHYPEAAVSYNEFIKLHPKHEKVSFAQFRIGLSYWKDAPTAIDREQDLTRSAISEWKKLIDSESKDKWAIEAKLLTDEGQKRILDSEEFISIFLCKQQKWHACAYRYLQLIDHDPQPPVATVKRALIEAAKALQNMLDEHESLQADDPQIKDDVNIFFKNWDKKQIVENIANLKERALKL